MLINKQLAQADIIALNPCGLYGDDNGTNYTPMRIARLFAGRETLALGDVLTMDGISISDRLWVVLNRGVLPESARIGLGCDYAERVLFIAETWSGNKGRSRLAIEVTRRWMRGEATDEERDAAAAYAHSAAVHAAYASAAAAAAAYAAADAAADAAAYAAADAAAYAAAAADYAADYAASYAEREWQLAHTIEVLSEAAQEGGAELDSEQDANLVAGLTYRREII